MPPSENLDIFSDLKKGDFLSSVDNKTVRNIIERLRAGVEVKPRSHYLRTYPESFVGEEAVSWMLDHIFTETREEAVAVGQMLLNHGALQHASVANAPFADGRQYFQFLHPTTYAANKSGFLGVKLDPTAPYRLRWCCLRNRHLIWYDKPHSLQPLSRVFLKDILISIPFPSVTANHAAIYTDNQCEFEVHVQAHVFTFVAKDAKDMKAWVETLYPFTLDAENERIEQAEEMLNKAAIQRSARNCPFAPRQVGTNTIQGRAGDENDEEEADVGFSWQAALANERGRLQLLRLRREMHLERREVIEMRQRPAADTQPRLRLRAAHTRSQMLPAQLHHHHYYHQRHPPPHRRWSWEEKEQPRDLQAYVDDGHGRRLAAGGLQKASREFPWLLDVAPSPAEVSNGGKEDNSRSSSTSYNFVNDDEEQVAMMAAMASTDGFRELDDDESALELSTMATIVGREASLTAESEIEVVGGEEEQEAWPLERLTSSFSHLDEDRRPDDYPPPLQQPEHLEAAN